MKKGPFFLITYLFIFQDMLNSIYKLLTTEGKKVGDMKHNTQLLPSNTTDLKNRLDFPSEIEDTVYYVSLDFHHVF